ncbi:MAG: hypothetical protein NT022_01605 [Deltaproteobacteria bacterium]|nr:hypothetical protein [Deltaproteobacteria bacterium]
MKKQKRWVVVIVVASCFSIGILFSGVSTLYAAEKPPVAQQINIKQLQETRKASKIPLHRTKTLDLRCEIKVYYDQARTKPISGGVWDWQTAINAKSLQYIYHDIIVENTGYPDPNQASPKARAAFVARRVDVKVDFVTPRPYDPFNPGQRVQTFTVSVVNLGPGESHVFSFYGPPPVPAEYIYDGATVDIGNKVKEESETNNKCSYKVSR